MATWREQDIFERLSISTFVFKNYRPVCERALEELAAMGFRSVELMQSPDQFELTRQDSMDHVARACRNAGMEICAYHAFRTNFAEMETKADRTDRLDQCKRQMDTLLECGGKIWGSHAREMDATGRGCIEELLKYAEGVGAVIVLENFTDSGQGVQDRMALIQEMDHPQLGLLLDIGHVRDEEGRNPMTLPGGPSQVIRQCGSKLYFLHLHGFVDGSDHWPPFAEGDGIQWKELFGQLQAAGYEGHFNFEPRGLLRHADALEKTAAAPGRIAGLLAG